MDYVRNGICIAMDLGNFGWNHWDVSFWSGMGGMWTVSNLIFIFT